MIASLAVSAALSLPASALAAAGDLDSTFDSDGVATMAAAEAGLSELTQIDVGPDSSIAGVGGASPSAPVIIKATSSGDLDATFGAGGVVRPTGIGLSNTVLDDVAMLPDGRVVVGGQGSSGMVLARYTTTGALDTTFDGDGFTTIDVPGEAVESFQAFHLLTDGRLLVTGVSATGKHTFTMLDGSGTLDTTFSGDGHAVDAATTTTLEDVDMLSDGRIVTASMDNTTWAIVATMYDANGVLDTSYASDGTANVAYGESLSELELDVQSDDKVVLGTTFLQGNKWDALVVRLTTAGALDTTWSGDGYAIVNYCTSCTEYMWGVEQQPDGKIVVGNGISQGPTFAPDEYAVARLTATGTLDTTFSADGMDRLMPPVMGGAPADLDLDPITNQALLAGYVRDPVGADAALVRWTTAGIPDTSFSADAIALFDVGVEDLSSNATVVDSSDRVLVGGGADLLSLIAARFTSTGAADTSFDGDGRRVFRVGGTLDSSTQIDGIRLRADGSTLIAGTLWGSSYEQFVSRLLPDGSIDMAYGGGDGVWLPPLPGSVNPGQALAVLQDGSAFVATTQSNATYDVRVWKLTPTGTLDTTFSGDGYVDLDTGAAEWANTIEVAPDGRLVVGGAMGGVGAPGFVMRLLPDGAWDTSFAGDGSTLISVGPGADTIDLVSILPDQRILVAGSTTAGAYEDIAIARLTSAGALDTSFSGDGKIQLSLSAGNDFARGLMIDGAGTALVASESGASPDADWHVMRLSLDGTLDTTFSGDGVTTVSMSAGQDLAKGIAWAANGRIVVTGTSGTLRHLAAARLIGCFVAPCPPTVISPIRWTSDPTPTLTASTYVDGEGDAHGASQWQVRTDAGTWAAPNEDSGVLPPTTTYDLAIPLAESQQYWVRVRYRDATGAWSNWSLDTPVMLDTTPPSGGSIAYPDGEFISTELAVMFTSPTDTGSGIEASLVHLERSTATYTAGTCGTWSAWSSIGITNPASPHLDSGLAVDTCYRYRYVVPDAAGNITNVTSTSIAILRPDTIAPSIPQGRRLATRTTTSVSMTWDQSTDNVTPSTGLVYDVDWWNGSSWVGGCSDVADAVRSCGQTGLTSGVPAYFRVRAQDAAGNTSSWATYADVTSTTFYLREGTNSAFLTSGSTKLAASGATTFTSTTVTPDLLGNSDYWQFLPAGTATSAASLPASINPPGTGRGWFVDAGAGAGSDPGGINDGPVTVRATTTATRNRGVGNFATRLFTTATNAGAPTTPTALVSTTTDTSVNVLGATSNQSVTTAHVIGAPTTWAVGESLYLEAWLDITTAPAAGGGAQVLRIANGTSATMELAPPGIRPAAPTALSPASGTSGASPPTLTATVQHPASVNGHAVFELWTDASGSPGTLLQTGYSDFELAPGTAGSWTPQQLANGSYHWRVRGEDRFGRVSAWSAWRTFSVGSAALTLAVTGVDHDGSTGSPADSALGTVLAGASSTSAFDVQVITSNPTGYMVTLHDSDGNGAMWSAGASASVPWASSGSVDAPVAWSGDGIGISAFGGAQTPARWCAGGAPNCTSMTDSDLLWAPLTGAGQQVTGSSSAFPAGDTTRIAVRSVVSASQAPGSYIGSVAVTAIANP